MKFWNGEQLFGLLGKVRQDTSEREVCGRANLSHSTNSRSTCSSYRYYRYLISLNGRLLELPCFVKSRQNA